MFLERGAEPAGCFWLTKCTENEAACMKPLAILKASTMNEAALHDTHDHLEGSTMSEADEPAHNSMLKASLSNEAADSALHLRMVVGCLNPTPFSDLALPPLRFNAASKRALFASPWLALLSA